jgi:hypothetical protein
MTTRICAPVTKTQIQTNFNSRYIIQMEPHHLQRQSNHPDYLVLGKHSLKQQPQHH